jgi:two-component system, NarL family, response regulator NreC
MVVRVVLAEDHAVVRQGLRALLEREGFQVAGEAADGRQAIDLASALLPDIAILDVRMPMLNGLDAAREIRKCCPKTKAILLTRHDEDQYVIEALHAGVTGYVLKSQMANDLLQAIKEVLRGGIYLSPGISRTVVQAYLSKTTLEMDPLTSRERQILQLIAEGQSSKDIANLLGISTKTAEAHRARIMRKLDLHGTASLVRYAIRRGLLEP